VVSQVRATAFVNCWGSQRLGIVDLASQSLTEAVVSVPAPTAAAELSVNRGRHFFFTGRTRWSNNAWSSCGSCHPDGLSDNMTWIFAAGPRQSTSMDGSYSKGATVKQRIFNWTGIIDEMHDFEGNTRGVQGGKGAVTTAATQGDCGTLANETAVALPANNLAGSVKELADQTGVVRCVAGAWDDIESFAKTIRAPMGRRALDPAAVTRGAAAFDEGQCAKCHGGPGWTVSRRFFTPSTAQNTSLSGTVVFARPSAWPSSWTFQNTFQVAAQPTAAELPGFNTNPVAPPQVACAIRNIGTFGVPGDATATDALELKPGTGGRAQGRGGYNVPALYGLQVAAPLLHHGQVASLSELFTDPRWDAHTQAGNAVFLPPGDPTNAAKRADLVQFLWSIDGTTPEKAIPAGFDTGCLP
jgi:cytochrome c peroxidase